VAARETRTPPGLAQAVRDAGCSPADVRELEREGRVVVVAPDLAYARTTYDDLADLALGMASAGPLSPAAFRDATGTSRKLALAILEDLDRSAILRRTADGHVPGPRAPRATPR
jgi:selenocysteine-specific elongation factor